MSRQVQQSYKAVLGSIEAIFPRIREECSTRRILKNICLACCKKTRSGYNAAPWSMVLCLYLAALMASWLPSVPCASPAAPATAAAATSSTASGGDNANRSAAGEAAATPRKMPVERSDSTYNLDQFGSTCDPKTRRAQQLLLF